jgi:hypothetical protein
VLIAYRTAGRADVVVHALVGEVRTRERTAFRNWEELVAGVRR